MTREDFIKDTIINRGRKVAEEARIVHLDPEALRRALAGKRRLLADELIALCVDLDIDIEDLQDKPSAWNSNLVVVVNGTA